MELSLKKPSKRAAVAVSAAVTSAALIMCAFTLPGFGGDSKTEGEVETVYRESKVTRGDITVGVSETATATLKTRDVKFDYEAEIEEIHIKSGQAVKKGDILVTLSLESLADELDDARTAYNEAVIALKDAEYDRKKGEISAESSKTSTLSKSETAGLTYDIEVEKLQTAVAKAEKEITELKREISGYTLLLQNIDNYDADYLVYNDAQVYYDDCKYIVDNLQKSYDESRKDDSYSKDALELMKNNLEDAKEELAAAKVELDREETKFERKYDTTMTDEDDIRDARSDSLDRLEDAELALREAEYDLELKQKEAEQERDEKLTSGENAEQDYEMTLAQLENAVSSKKLKVEAAQKDIAELETALRDNTLVSPCDGVIASVNYSEGDEVQQGQAIVTISDLAYVYVYVTVAQDDIANVQLGQSAELVMDAFEEERFTGIVDSITTTPARSASGTASYNVTVQAQGDDVSKIFEGMTGTATLVTRQQKDVLYVSNRCVFEKGGGSYVKVKENDGTLVEIKVETGFSDGRNVEITSGLAEGQTVIIESQVASAG